MAVKRPTKRAQREFLGKLKLVRDTVKALVDEARELYGTDVEDFSLEVEEALWQALQPLEEAVRDAEEEADA